MSIERVFGKSDVKALYLKAGLPTVIVKIRAKIALNQRSNCLQQSTRKRHILAFGEKLRE